MLLQSQAGEIELLPALPTEWPTGSITGLRARGGYEVSETWEKGKLVSAMVKNVSGTGETNVRYGDQVIALDLPPGKTKSLNAALE